MGRTALEKTRQEDLGNILTGTATAAIQGDVESASDCKGDGRPAIAADALRLAREHNRSWMLAVAVVLLAPAAAQGQSVFATPQPVFTTSAAQNVTITAQAAGTVNQVKVLTLGMNGLEFSKGAGALTCESAILASGATCQESVAFTPAYPGLRVGAVVLLDSGSNVLGTAYVSGTGWGGLGVFFPGNVTTVAGVYRNWTSTQDGIPATNANLEQPSSIAFDGAGNMYIADSGSTHNQIRMVCASGASATIYGTSCPGAGIIMRIAGTGVPGYSGDGGPASASTLSAPSGLALDGAGNLYIADTGNNVIRKITAATGVISTVAGSVNGTAGYAGDGGLATSAELNSPQGVTVDGSGSLYIADTANQRIRMVAVPVPPAVAGIITTVAGNGEPSGSGDGKGTYSGDGQPATVAGLSLPYAVAFDASGNMYIPDSANNRIRMVNPSGTISTVVGTGAPGDSCANWLGNQVALNTPSGVAVDAAGNLYIADTEDSCIEETNATTGTVTAIAVNGGTAVSSSGTLGLLQVYAPVGLYLDGNGNLYFADFYDMLIEEVQRNRAILNFMATPIRQGSASAPQNQIVENNGNTALDLTAITPDQNAAVNDTWIKNACTTGDPFLAVDASCQIGAVFAPSSSLVFPPSITSEQMIAHIDIGKSGDTANSPLDIELIGEAEVVNSTTVTVASSNNPSEFGQSVTFTATVTTGAGTGNLTGTVSFFDGATALAADVALNAPPGTTSAATFTTTALKVGLHTITATYNNTNDVNHFSSTSAPLAQTVVEGTATSLASNVNPSAVGQNVTFTATVTISGGGGVTPDGTVTFCDGATPLQTVAINSSGVATYSTAALAQGLNAITATYNGDAAQQIQTSTSNVVNQDVQASTSIVVTSMPNPSGFGIPITFTATVTPNAAAAATGVVNFLDGGKQIGTANLVGTTNQATFTTAALAAGSHTITVVYQGSSNYAPSTSAAITQTVNPTQTSTTVAAAPNPGIAGLAGVITATVKLTAGAATPTGTVSFTDTFHGAAVTLGSQPLGAAGTATLNPTLAPGTHSIVATYSGDANNNSSASAPFALTVNLATTAATITTTPNPILVLAPITFTATVTGNGGQPTGSVSFYANATTLLGAANLKSDGTATITNAGLAAGSYQITAVYAGDTNDAGATSAAVTQVVGVIPTATAVGVSTTGGNSPSIILVATVIGATGPTPTGTVTFNSGSTALGSALLDSSGVATLNANLASGVSYAIAAVYGGDALHGPSTSGPVNVSGTPTAYTITVTPPKLSLAQSQNATVNVTLTSASGFADTIGLGCGSLPAGVTCHFSSLDVTLTANASQTVQLTIDSNNPLGGGASATIAHPGNRGVSLAGLLLPFSVFFGGVVWRFRRRYAPMRTSALVLLLCGAAMPVTGCSGMTQITAAPGTYVIQVFGAGVNSNISCYQNVTLTITQ